MGQTASTSGSLERRGSSGSASGGVGSFVDSNWDSFLHEQIRKHSQTLRQLTLLTYDDLLDKICQLNTISSKYVDCKGKQLLFEVKPGSAGNVLWKGTVRIKVMKIDPEKESVVEKTRELNLKQFLQLYNTLEMMMIDSNNGSGSQNGTPRKLSKTVDSELTEEEEDHPEKKKFFSESSSKGGGDGDEEEGVVGKATLKEESCGGGASGGGKVGKPSRLIPPIMDTSIILDNLDSKFGEECCICMENRPEVSLPCAHSYCLPCIEQWNVDHKTCPICREKLETTDDTWVLEERPDAEQVDQEIQKSLFDLF
ncbi:unnamed protein product [Orchesella dallaii]|uniref:RING finger protein 141 n=1 Tax=Orchesella dallaii TaxID=48710 RepID=A0ABP1RYR9_9HEXA